VLSTPKRETIEFQHSGYNIHRPDLAIINADDFSLAQEILSGNRQWARIQGRDAKPDRYLLLDHIFCVCGCRMTSKTLSPGTGKPYYYYRCASRYYPVGKDKCREISVRSATADTILWTWLEMLLGMGESLLRTGLNKLATEQDNETQGKRESINAANAQIEAIGKKITNLMRAFDGDDDEDVVASLRQSVNELKKAKAELITYRDKLAGEISVSTLSQSQIEDIVTFSRQIKKKMAHGTYEYKKELLRMLKVRVDLRRDKDGYRLDMSCALPGGKHSEKLPLGKSHSSNR
jgi:hypothetical protein